MKNKSKKFSDLILVSTVLLMGVLGWYKVLNFWFLKAFEPFWLRSVTPYTFFSLMRTHAFLYYLDWRLFGWQPWGWYLVGIVMHLLAVVLLYIFLVVVTKRRLFAFLATFFFVANICYNDVLTWGSFNSYYPLLLICMIASLLFYHWYRRTKNVVYFICTLFFFASSLIIRETGLLIAPLLTLFDFFFSEEKKNLKFWKRFLLRQIPIYIVILGFMKFRTLTGGISGDGQDENVQMQVKMMAEHLYVDYAKAIILTIGKLVPPQFIPYPMLNSWRTQVSALYVDKPEMLSAISLYFFPALGWILLAITSVAVLLLRKIKAFGKVMTFFWLWMGLSLAFVGVAVPNTIYVLSSDYTSITMRYRYFAFVGMASIFAVLVTIVYDRVPKRITPFAKNIALCLILIIFARINLSLLWQIEDQVYASDYQPEKVFFTQFRHEFPTLPQNATFYFYPYTTNLNNLLYEWYFIKDSWYPNLANQPYRSESQMEMILRWLKEKKLQLSDVFFLDYNNKDGMINRTKDADEIITHQKDYALKMTASQTPLATVSAGLTHFESPMFDGPFLELPYAAQVTFSTNLLGSRPTKDANSSLFRELADYSAERQQYLQSVKIETCASLMNGADPVLHLLPQNIVDGLTGPRSSWIADAIPGWVIADLGKQQEVDGVIWSETLGARRPSTYTILSSKDHTNWKEEKVVNHSDKPNAILQFDHPIMARYIKMLVKTTDSGNSVSLDEFEVVGSKGRQILSKYTDADQLIRDAQNIFQFAASPDDIAYAQQTGMNLGWAKMSWFTGMNGTEGSFEGDQQTFFTYKLNQANQVVTFPIPESEIYAGPGLMLKKRINKILLDFGYSPSTISLQSVTLVPRQKL